MSMESLKQSDNFVNEWSKMRNINQMRYKNGD